MVALNKGSAQVRELRKFIHVKLNLCCFRLLLPLKDLHKVREPSDGQRAYNIINTYICMYIRCFRLLLSMKDLHKSESLESLGLIEIAANSSLARERVRLEGRQSVYRYLQATWRVHVWGEKG